MEGMNKYTLISVHLPKTAGVSFGRLLADFFKDSYLTDYQDFSMHKKKIIRKIQIINFIIRNLFKIKRGVCIHGHFFPIKYSLLNYDKNIKYAVWLRNPVERLASHYYYWKRTYNKEKSLPLHKKVIEENWTLEDFCFCKELRNIYTQYLWGFKLEKFNFIGITEFYNEDIKFFSKYFLNDDGKVYHENINNEVNNKKYILNPDLITKIEKFHQKDVILYRKALVMRASRLKSVKSNE